MSYVKVKTGVKPKIIVMMAAIANVTQTMDEPNDITITSGNDSVHMKGSLHYKDAALDVRTKNFPSAQSKRAFLAAVLKRLGSGYQGFLEYEGKAQEHIHLEFDPD